MTRHQIYKALIILMAVAVVLLVFGAYHSPTMAYYLEEFKFC